MLAQDQKENQLLDFLRPDEDRILGLYTPVTCALAVVRSKGSFVLLHNDEMSAMCLYTPGGSIRYVNESDRALLKYGD
jgi:hypothetical protein